jgi:hypothetical protein
MRADIRVRDLCADSRSAYCISCGRLTPLTDGPHACEEEADADDVADSVDGSEAVDDDSLSASVTVSADNEADSTASAALLNGVIGAPAAIRGEAGGECRCVGGELDGCDCGVHGTDSSGTEG